MVSSPSARDSTLRLLLGRLGPGLDSPCLGRMKTSSHTILLADGLTRFVFVTLNVVFEGCPPLALVAEQKLVEFSVPGLRCRDCHTFAP